MAVEAITVSQLIQFLQEQPQHLKVAYQCYSEYALLETKDVEQKRLCFPRDDGWVHETRPDKETEEYLVLPGN